MGAYKLVATSELAKRHTQGGSCDVVLPSGRTAIEPVLLGRNVPPDAGHIRYPPAWAHISSRHAKLFADKAAEGNERWSVMDTSTNGTFVNDVRVPQGTSVALKPGDRLRLSVPGKGANGGVIEYEFVYDEHYQEPNQSLPYSGNKRKTASTGQLPSSPGVKRNRSTSPSNTNAPEASLAELQRLAANNKELRGQAAAYRQQIDTSERQLSDVEAANVALKNRMEQDASKAAHAQQEAAAAAAAQLDAAMAATAAADARAAEADARAAQAEQASAGAAAEAAAAMQAKASLQEQLQRAQTAHAELRAQVAAAQQGSSAAQAAADAAAAAAADTGAELARVRAASAAAEALVEAEREAHARAARDAARALASAERRAASAAEHLDTERERRLVQARAARASAALAKDVMAGQLRQWRALVEGGEECFRQLGAALEGVALEQEEGQEGGGVSVEGDGDVQTSEAHTDYQQTQAFSHHQALQHSDAGQAGNQTPRSHSRRSDAGMEATLAIAQAPIALDLNADGGMAVDGVYQEGEQKGEVQQQQQKEEDEKEEEGQQKGEVQPQQQQQEGEEKEEEVQHMDQHEQEAGMQQDGNQQEEEEQQQQEERLQESQLKGDDGSQDKGLQPSPAAATSEQDGSAQQPQQQQDSDATQEDGTPAARHQGGDHAFQGGSPDATDGTADDDGAEDDDGRQQEEQQGSEGQEAIEHENGANDAANAPASHQRTPGSALADNTNRPGLGSAEDADFIPLGSMKTGGFEAGQRGETLALLSGLPAGEVEGNENAMQE